MLNNRYNLTIWQGSTFGLTIQLTDANSAPRDLSGQSARMQIRSTYDSTNIVESLTSANGEISFTNASIGIIQLDLAADRTAAIPVDLTTLQTVRLADGTTTRLPKQTYVYDLELINGNVVTKILYGDAIVYGEVTR